MKRSRAEIAARSAHRRPHQITRRLVQLPSGDRGRPGTYLCDQITCVCVLDARPAAERLIASAPARVVNTASAPTIAPSSTSTTCNRLTAIGIQGVRSAPSSATFLYTRELARRWAGHGGHRQQLHPGICRHSLCGSERRPVLLHRPHGKEPSPSRPRKGADTIVYLASSLEVAHVSGGYFYKMSPAMPSKDAQDAARNRLWQESTRLGGIGANLPEPLKHRSS